MKNKILHIKKIVSLLLLYVIIPSAVYILIINFVAFPIRVDGVSMYPTLKGGHIVFVSRLSSNYLEGDIVVFKANDGRYNGELVKRIVAGPNREVIIDNENHLVYVDGILLVEDYAVYDGETNMGSLYFVVPNDCFFVLGDNRNHSVDSRNKEIGFVSKCDIIGKVF